MLNKKNSIFDNVILTRKVDTKTNKIQKIGRKKACATSGSCQKTIHRVTSAYKLEEQKAVISLSTFKSCSKPAQADWL